MGKILQFQPLHHTMSSIASLEVFCDLDHSPPIAVRMRVPLSDPEVRAVVDGEGVEVGVLMDWQEAQVLCDALNEGIARCKRDS